MPRIYRVKTLFEKVFELEVLEKTRSIVVLRDRETGILYKVNIKKANGDRYILSINGEDHVVYANEELILIDSSPSLVRSITPLITQEIKKEKREEGKPVQVLEPGLITSPISGKIIDVKVNQGNVVKAGDTLLLLESMKMVIEVKSPMEGVVEKIYVEKGASVNKGDRLVKIKLS
ncbi:MAG: biotin/lipoyl-containing protein [Desulfurococcaceae archaeon]